MQNARKRAQSAPDILNPKGTVDKGGHKIQARKHLEAAIAALNAGIAYDNANVSGNEGKKGKKKG